MDVRYMPRAVRDLKKLDAKIAARLRKKVNEYAANPAAFANQIKALQGLPGWRLRVGDYRIIFTKDGLVLTVLSVGHRRDIYR